MPRMANRRKACARSLRKESLDISRRAIPMIAKASGKRPPAARSRSAGTRRRWVRSPEAPKMTKQQGPAGGATFAGILFILVQPTAISRLFGAIAFRGSSAELNKIVVEQTEKWSSRLGHSL